MGVSIRFLAGKPLAGYVILDDRPAFRGGLDRLLQVGRRQGWVIRMQTRWGEAFDAAITAAVVRDWDGAPVSVR